MAKTQTFTKLSPAEATAEVASALTAAGFAARSVTSSPQMIGRQRKMYLTTVATGLDGQAAPGTLALLRELPDVCYSGTMGRGTVYVCRRLA